MKIKKMNTLVVLATNTRHVGQLNFFNSGKAGLNTGIANNTKPIPPTPIPPTPTKKEHRFPWVLYAKKLRNKPFTF